MGTDNSRTLLPVPTLWPGVSYGVRYSLEEEKCWHIYQAPALPTDYMQSALRIHQGPHFIDRLSPRSGRDAVPGGEARSAPHRSEKIKNNLLMLIQNV